MPTCVTALPMHWVPAHAVYVSRGRPYRGTISIGGWPTACGILVAPIPHDPGRRECHYCASRADHPYHREHNQ